MALISNILLTSNFSIDSFDHLNQWLNEIKTKSSPDIKVFLIGNKADLENMRKVSKEEAEKFTQESNLNLFMETSAKSGFNAKQVFIEAAKCLYEEHLKYKEKIMKGANSNSSAKLPVTTSLKKNDYSSTNKKCC